MASRTTAQRGYGARHQRMRVQIRRAMTAGKVFVCWRCGEPINPAEPWDLGHDDHDRSIYRGPEHRDCNRGARPQGRPRHT